jgi:cephalosporin hydroxylase
LFQALGKARVIGIDQRIAPADRKPSSATLAQRITLIEGDSIAPK